MPSSTSRRLLPGTRKWIPSTWPRREPTKTSGWLANEEDSLPCESRKNGTFKLLEPARFVDKMRPLFAERAGSEPASSLVVESQGDACAFGLHGERLDVPNQADLLRLFIRARVGPRGTRWGAAWSVFGCRIPTTDDHAGLQLRMTQRV